MQSESHHTRREPTQDSRSSPPPSIIEELYILLLNREGGGIVNINERNVRYAFAGAALMELAKAYRIDTDLENLIFIDPTPLGDDILDPLLSIITRVDDKTDTVYWIKRFSAPEISNQIRRRAAERLIDRGIFSRDPGGTILLDPQVSRTRRYTGVALPYGQDVLLRVMNVIFSEDIPAPDETMLIALGDVCGIFKKILSKSELADRKKRIELVGKLDVIGLSVRNAILTVKKPGTKDKMLRRAFLKPSPGTYHKRPPLVPGSLPLLGHALRLRPTPTKPLAKYYQSLGPVFRVRDLLGELTVLAGPEANRFCQKHSRSLFRSHATYTPFFESMDAQRIILSMDGEEHFKLRRAISSGFSGKRFLSRLPAIRDIILGELPENGSIVAIEAFSQLTAKSIGLACTGYLMSDKEVQGMDFFLRRMIASKALRSLPEFMAYTPRARRSKAVFFDIFNGMLKKRLDEGGNDGQEDVVDAMLELHRSNPQFLPEHELRVSCLGPIFSGLHTTASTGTSAMYLLLKHPHILERVREEAHSLYSDGHPNPEKMNTLDVTRRVVFETLRMYNPFNSVFRHAVNTFNFGGYTIPAGTRLFLPISVPHYCPEFFPDPNRFDIDRYLPERGEHKQPGVYMPFGFGTHQCLGNVIANAHLMFSLTTILHYLDVQMDPTNYEMKIAFYGFPAATKKFKLKCMRHPVMTREELTV